ncbi:hypothetical protein EGH21_12615 [Halomicroarcula sp. F13]|uniref:Uncharacterized protein n=1 Tax=Haloarcula rubra TaxID=2487747 RepID=A0AAW4PQK3_9EURY|nr:hypothetical protein [Halomicroarcula rubra]MBX0323873.1 hypothetical protein [Halomicroarcula rubra]
MTAPYSLATLTHPQIAPEAIATLTSLGAAAYIGAATAAAGQYALTGFAVLAVLGLLVALKRVDRRARYVEELTTT